MKASVRFIHLLPRVLCIGAIFFISIFSFDVFGHGDPFWTQVVAFLMHMIPSFILLIILLIAWKWEVIGGIIFILIGAIATPLVYSHNYAMNQSVGMSLMIVGMITIPFVIIGVLFIIAHKMKKKHGYFNSNFSAK